MKPSNPSLVTLSCVLATLLMAGCNNDSTPTPAAPAPRGPLTTAEFLDHLNAQAAHNPEAQRILALINNQPPSNPPGTGHLSLEQIQFLISLVATQSTDPAGDSVNSDADWRKGAHEAPPAWTGYPFATVDGVRVKTVAALQGLVDEHHQPLATDEFQDHDSETHAVVAHRCIHFEMAGRPSDPLAPGQDADGFSPRNMTVNRALAVNHPHREAMPVGLANQHHSLFQDRFHLTAAATDWINIRYRSSSDPLYTPETAATFVNNYYDDASPLTYEQVMFDVEGDDFDDRYMRFDHHGRPLNPNPYLNDIGISGQGFYFRLGPNQAKDVLVTVKHNNRIYAVLNQRNEPGTPLSFPGGMDDLSDSSRLETVFRELNEETGLALNREQLEADRMIVRAWSGPVAAETRQTRNAWTVSTLFHIHFDSIAQMEEYGALNDAFDGHEVANRSLVDLSYVIPTYLAPSHASNMFASHGPMLSFAIGKFLSTHPEEVVSLMQPMQGPTLNDNKIDFRELNRLMQVAHAARVAREAAPADTQSVHSEHSVLSDHEDEEVEEDV